LELATQTSDKAENGGFGRIRNDLATLEAPPLPHPASGLQAEMKGAVASAPPGAERMAQVADDGERDAKEAVSMDQPLRAMPSFISREWGQP
jgi:hypothetical protein